MFRQQKKVSVLHLSVCSFGDQSSQLILCLDRFYIFLDLDCPALVWLSNRGQRPQLDNYQTLAGQSRSRKMKISLSANELRLSDSPLLSNYFPAAWNYSLLVARMLKFFVMISQMVKYSTNLHPYPKISLCKHQSVLQKFGKNLSLSIVIGT